MENVRGLNPTTRVPDLRQGLLLNVLDDVLLVVSERSRDVAVDADGIECRARSTCALARIARRRRAPAGCE